MPLPESPETWDLGAGAGIPGIPLRLVWDSGTFTLVEVREKRVLFLELGVGMNTPVISKYPFWQMTRKLDRAFYICVNRGQAWAPEEISERSLCMDGDIAEILNEVRAQ